MLVLSMGATVVSSKDADISAELVLVDTTSAESLEIVDKGQVKINGELSEYLSFDDNSGVSIDDKGIISVSAESKLSYMNLPFPKASEGSVALRFKLKSGDGLEKFKLSVGETSGGFDASELVTSDGWYECIVSLDITAGKYQMDLYYEAEEGSGYEYYNSLRKGVVSEGYENYIRVYIGDAEAFSLKDIEASFDSARTLIDTSLVRSSYTRLLTAKFPYVRMLSFEYVDKDDKEKYNPYMKFEADDVSTIPSIERNLELDGYDKVIGFPRTAERETFVLFGADDIKSGKLSLDFKFRTNGDFKILRWYVNPSRDYDDHNGAMTLTFADMPDIIHNLWYDARLIVDMDKEKDNFSIVMTPELSSASSAEMGEASAEEFIKANTITATVTHNAETLNNIKLRIRQTGDCTYWANVKSRIVK